MNFTKQIISYKLYKDEQGNKVKVGKKNKLTIYLKGCIWAAKFEDLDKSEQEKVMPLIRFVETDLKHDFKLIEE